MILSGIFLHLSRRTHLADECGVSEAEKKTLLSTKMGADDLFFQAHVFFAQRFRSILYLLRQAHHPDDI